MSTTFPDYKGLNLPEVGDEILNLWEENNIFEKKMKIFILWISLWIELILTKYY